MKKLFLKLSSSLIGLGLALASGSSLVFGISQERKDVVNYMREMATIEWTPSEDITYWNLGLGLKFEKGKTYFGIPYTQNNRNANLSVFKDNLNEKNEYTGSTESGYYYGNDPISAICMAWERAARKPVLARKAGEGTANKDGFFNWFKYPGTYEIFNFLAGEKSTFVFTEKFLRVGNYTIPKNTISTDEIIKHNTVEVVKDSYSKLQPGDALVVRIQGVRYHIVLVSEVDVENQKVKIIEQRGTNDKGNFQKEEGNFETTVNSKKINTSWNVDKEMIFDELLENKFLPVTIETLTKIDAIKN